MDPSKALFGDSCEGGNVFGTMINSLVNQNIPHPIGYMMDNAIEDAWEHGEAMHEHEELMQHWDMPHEQHEYDEMWDVANKLGEDPMMEQAWEGKDQLEEHWIESESIKDSTRSILDVLSTQSDPKFQNSEFFKFIERLHTGRAKIENGELIENFEDVWTAEKQEHPEETELWNGLTINEREKFEEIWNKAHETDEERMIREWGSQWDNPKPADTYELSNQNPYLDIENPYELALNKLAESNYADGILLLESELSRNNENSQAWHLLGNTFALLDDDFKASSCFKSGLEHDPYNINIILSLAISSINSFDHSLLTNYFTMWLKNNSEYDGIIFSDINNLEMLKQVYITASELNPNDVNIYISLGVLEFADNNFEAAEYYFNLANNFGMDYDLLNKIGVTLMKQGKNSIALEYFKKSLSIRPDYVKAWSNMGKTYAADGGNYKQAIECYLSGAIVYGSEHLFEFTRSALVMMGREDLIEKLLARNPLSFADEFNIMIPPKRIS